MAKSTPLGAPAPAPTPTALRCAIYLRVSDPGAKDAYGMEVQREQCLAYAERMGWVVVAIFEDWHTGADLFARPEVGRLRALVRGGGVDVVLVHRVDRLSRMSHHIGFIRTELEMAGAELASATEDLSNPIVVGVMGGIAEADRTKILENTKKGRAKKVAKGQHMGCGVAPYGMRWEYVQVGDAMVKARIVRDDATAWVVERIFRAYTTGKSLRLIAKGLDRDGIRPHRSVKENPVWHPSSVRHILKSRVYVGEGTWKADNDETVTRLADGTYPVLIDPATFELAQRRFAANQDDATAFRAKRNPQVGLLRNGLAYCGRCGARLMVGRDNRGHIYYCRPDRRYTGACTGGGTMKVADLDAAAWAYLADVLTDPGRIAAHLANLRANDPTTADLATLDRMQAELERQRSSLGAAVAALAGNPDATADLVHRLDGIGKHLAAVARDRSDIAARQAAWRADVAALADLETRCREVGEAVALATEYADRRELLMALRVRVDLFPAKAPERWVVSSGAVAEVATNLSSSASRPEQTRAALPLRWSSRDAARAVA